MMMRSVVVVVLLSCIDWTIADSEDTIVSLEDTSLGKCACQNISTKSSPSIAFVNFTGYSFFRKIIWQGDERHAGSLVTPYSILSFSMLLCDLMSDQDACEKNKVFNSDRVIKGDNIKVQFKLKLSDGTLLNKDQIEEIIISKHYVHPPKEKEFNPYTAIIKMKEKMYEGIGKTNSFGKITVQPICLPKSSRNKPLKEFLKKYVFNGRQCIGHEAERTITGRNISQLRGKQLVQELIKEKKVFMISKLFCPHCVMAKLVLTYYEIRPEFKEILEIGQRADSTEIMEYMEKLTGASSVPRLFIGGKFVGGASDIMSLHLSGKLLVLLTKAGALV